MLGEVEPYDTLVGNRHSVWVRLFYVYRNKVADGPDKEDVEKKVQEETHYLDNHHNDIFIFRKDKHGRIKLVDSQFFNTLGRRQQWRVLDDLLLGSILVLALMGFWVWMGFEAFRKRPRSHFWRAVVLLVPLVGAVSFFIGSYLPGLRRGRLAAEQT